MKRFDCSKNINNLKDYSNYSLRTDKEIMLLNLTTVLTLTKLKSFEIEYFARTCKNGAAFTLFERLLELPPSKTWGMLGKELINVLKFWVEAVKRHVTNNIDHWWSFLKHILEFVKEISFKDQNMPDLLVEVMSESLFVMSTGDILNPQQQHVVLQCLNIYCAQSSREIRFALRSKFDSYFIKLARQLPASGYLPSQFAALEALLRWLIPRGERTLRAAAADKWFPHPLCPDTAREIFLKATWMNFAQDARDFLNAVNETNGLVTSVRCRRFSIGDIVVTGAEKQHWLDINTSGSSVTVILEPRALQRFGVSDATSWEVLLVNADTTKSAMLHSESQELTLSVTTHQPLRVQPSGAAVGSGCEVTIVLSSSVYLATLNTALRRVFADKYQGLVDLYGDQNFSPDTTDPRKNTYSSEEDSRFSIPAQIPRRRHTGQVNIRGGRVRSLISPSTASTSSLIQLRDKLTALPRYIFDKEPVSVCAQPQLSKIDETNDDNSDLRHLRSGYFNVKRKAGSDTETKTIRHLDQDVSKTVRYDKNVSKRVSNDPSSSTSCLLTATVGTDKAVLNDTIERLSKSKDYTGDNIVDLLLQESLEAEIAKQQIDSGIISGDRYWEENNSEAIENTPVQEAVIKDKKSKSVKKKTSTVVIKSTTEDEESNTEAIKDTPAYVKRVLRSRSERVQSKWNEEQAIDTNVVDDFFSHHCDKAENNLISPTLARKINRSSSDTSECFEELETDNLNKDKAHFDFQDVVDCVNEMLGEVCRDFYRFLNIEEKKVEDKKSDKSKNKKKIQPKSIEKKVIEDSLTTEEKKKVVQKSVNSKNKKRQSKTIENNNIAPVLRPRRNITPTFKVNENKMYKPLTPKKKQNVKSKKMSTIIELNDEVIATVPPVDRVVRTVSEKNNTVDISPTYDNITIKRKRKLYSPKDEVDKNEQNESRNSDESDVCLATIKTNKPATPYQELVAQKKKNIQSRKSETKVQLLSPRTQKRDALFDKVKSTVENNERIVFADKKSTTDVYNFTSEEEDDNFEKKKIEPKKRRSSTIIGSIEPATTKRNSRATNRSKKTTRSATDEIVKPVRKRAPRGTNKRNADVIKSTKVLEDERMRKASTENLLNTSFVAEKPVKEDELKLHLKQPLRLEFIEQDNKHAKKRSKKIHSVDQYCKSSSSNVCQRPKSAASLCRAPSRISSDGSSVSPLPGLIVENVSSRKDDEDVTTLASIEQKIRNEGLNAFQACKKVKQKIQFPGRDSPYIDIIDEISMDWRVIESPAVEEVCDKIQPKIKQDKSRPDIKAPKQQSKATLNNRLIKNSNDMNVAAKNTDDRSEISIASEEITAHGDINESPPNIGMLTESVPPRDLVDMNERTTEILKRLSRSPSKDQSNLYHKYDEIKNAEIPGVEKNSKERSPVVQLQRLSMDDINSLISRRSSSLDSLSNDKMPKKVSAKKITRSNNDRTKSVQEMSVTDNATFDLVEPRFHRDTSTNRIADDKVASKLKANRVERKADEYLSADYEIDTEKTTNANDTKKSKVQTTQNIPIAPKEVIQQSYSKKVIQRKASTSTKEVLGTSADDNGNEVFKLPAKRKSSTIELDSLPKTPKKDSVIDILMRQESDTISTVESWFQRVDSPNPEDQTSLIIDKVKNLKEKIETTVEENNENSIKLLKHLYVEYQHKFEAMNRARSLYMAKKHQRWEQRYADLTAQFGERGETLIKEECKRRRATVNILKDDIQAVLEHLDKIK